MTKLCVPGIQLDFGAVRNCYFFCFSLPSTTRPSGDEVLCACAGAQDVVTLGYLSCIMVTEMRHSTYQSPFCLQTPVFADHRTSQQVYYLCQDLQVCLNASSLQTWANLFCIGLHGVWKCFRS